jgi:capsular polysaccharide biosynthesis protein
MIRDVSLLELVKASSAEFIATTLAAPDVPLAGLKMRDGQFVVRDMLCLPVVNGMTCLDYFAQVRPQHYDALRAAPPPVSGLVRDTVYVGGSSNYYHFLIFDFPTLLLMSALEADVVSLTVTNDFPSSARSVLAGLLPVLANNRKVQFVKMGNGAYDVRNAIFPSKPPPALAIFFSRNIVLPHVLGRLNIADPRDLGEVKLFVSRKGAGGRNLTNQGEVQDYFIKRGYTPVDPGVLSMEEQIVLFARATHIVGVEGAAMTNILFAVNAQRVTILANPVQRTEVFFSKLAELMSLRLVTIYGVLDTSRSIARNDDFAVPVANLDLVVQD